MGFFDVIGQTGMQVAPMLFQMGVEKGKAEREIGAAALNMYMNELDKGRDRSGPFTVVYENTYERDENGGLKYDVRGEPITTGRRRLQTYFRKSPEIMAYMDMNNQFGFDKFTFVDSSTDESGQHLTGLGDQFAAAQETKASRDRKRDYASFLGKGLDVMADFIMPTIIADKDTLTGLFGEIGRKIGPKWSAVQQILDSAVLDGMGGEKELNKLYNAQLDEMSSAGYIVNRSPTPGATKVVNGKTLEFFIDVNNEYAFNKPGGEATWLVTNDSMTRLLRSGS